MQIREQTLPLVHIIRFACALLILLFVIWLPTSMQAQAQQKQVVLPSVQPTQTPQATVTGQQNIVRVVPPPGNSTIGLSIYHTPSLTAAQVNLILKAAESPAAGTGNEFYSQSQSTGIDDAVALAFYQHESSFGTAGMAISTHSIGNIRCYNQSCVGGYEYYANYASAIDDWYLLIQKYKGWFGGTTIETIIPHYAPNADNNNEHAYISAVEASVNNWRKVYN